ncbi:hypothetical protein ACFGVR_17725 [Mucilaginibacter sp. AW1-3]
MDHQLTQQELIECISADIGKPNVLKLADTLLIQDFPLAGLIGVTLHPEREIAFRAAWTLETLVLGQPSHFIDQLDQLIAPFCMVKNTGCQRHYARILDELTAPKADKAIKAKMLSMDLEPVAERCFDLMIEPKTPIAVKVFASQLAFNLRHRYDWIAEILTGQLQIMMNGGKPAIRARGRVLLEQLTKR